VLPSLKTTFFKKVVHKLQESSSRCRNLFVFFAPSCHHFQDFVGRFELTKIFLQESLESLSVSKSLANSIFRVRRHSQLQSVLLVTVVVVVFGVFL
jgi:hypothetical protein